MLINDHHVELIHKLIISDKANSYIYLPNNVKIIKEYEEARIENEHQEVMEYEIEIIDKAFLPNGHKIIRVEEEESNNNNVCRISNEDIVYPLHVRTRKHGDKMLLKNRWHRKVKDIFIDSKVPASKRDKWPIVVDSTDKIIWITGIKKSKFTNQKNESYDIILRYD